MTGLQEERVLVLAPGARDAERVNDVLREAGHAGRSYDSLPALARGLGEGAGCLLLAEESLKSGRDALEEALASQPPWSDVPLIVLTLPGTSEAAVRGAIADLDVHSSITLLERPLRKMTLLHTVEAALKARRRQYELRDLHEDLEGRVKERTTDLEKALEDLRVFSYGLSHDLRSPLGSIVGHARIVLSEQGDALPVETRTSLARILEAATRMERFIDSVLAYTRLSQGSVSLVPLSLRDVVNELLSHVAPAARDRGARIDVLEPWPRVMADASLALQALLNLVTNALKFVAPGTVPHVVLRAERRPGAVRVWVEDNGVGIAPEHATRLFKLFERLHSQREFPGSGIGLALVKSLMTRMNGGVGVEAKEGGGSRFFVDFQDATADDSREQE